MKIKIFVFVLLFFCFLTFFILGFIFSRKLLDGDCPEILEKKVFRVSFVSDIHAGSQDRRSMEQNTPGNVIYPADFVEFLPEALNEMKLEGVSLLVSLGDQFNTPSLKYAQVMKDIIDQSGMEVLWARGNHDKEDVINYLGINGTYFYEDYDNWRIIVLDTNDKSENDPYKEGITKKQLDWFREVSDTEKNIIVAMHHPVWDWDNAERIHPVYRPLIEEFEKKNVKYVFSGHLHLPWQKEKNGIEYVGMPAFLLEGMEGNYRTFDLLSYRWFWQE
ncbi:MAG: metallophosphoesterase [Parcubacteria group bacterium]